VISRILLSVLMPVTVPRPLIIPSYTLYSLVKYNT
jgi:hypothetical protein